MKINASNYSPPNVNYWGDRCCKAEAALELCMIGGNHLANDLIGKLGGDFATKYPPSMNEQDALLQLGAYYDIWSCWAAIMRARDGNKR